MLTIRLARTGRKKLAHYRVVAADSRRAATGKFVAQLGHYNPHTKELVIDDSLTQQYLDKGAQPSSRVVHLLQNHKSVNLPEWAKKNLVVKAEKLKEEPAVEEPMEEPSEQAAEAEAEEPEAAASTEAEPAPEPEEKAEAPVASEELPTDSDDKE